MNFRAASCCLSINLSPWISQRYYREYIRFNTISRILAPQNATVQKGPGHAAAITRWDGS